MHDSKREAVDPVEIGPFSIGPATINPMAPSGYPGMLTVHIDGYPFRAGEKYTILEQGWTVYLAQVRVPSGWMQKHGERRRAGDGWNALESGNDILVTSHPILVALALYAARHDSDRVRTTDEIVPIPTFKQAVYRVRRRQIYNDFNRCYAGQVPGLERWERAE